MSTENTEKELLKLFDEFAELVNSEEAQKNQKDLESELELIKKSKLKITFILFLEYIQSEYGLEYSITNFSSLKGSFAYYITSLNNSPNIDLDKFSNLTASDFFTKEQLSKTKVDDSLSLSRYGELVAELVNSYHSYLLQRVS